MEILSVQNLLLTIIRNRINNHPRSQQKEIGPSEIGHPCLRWMGYKLNLTPTVGYERDKWRPTVGTAVHSWLAKTFEAANAGLDYPAFVVEQQVSVGEVYNGDGVHVYGGCDLYVARTVVDWKIVGKTTLDKVRKKNDPGEQYRIQVHSYGRGHVRAGRPVDTVAVFFLPSSGVLDDGVWWEEPYDETVCTDALTRVSAVRKMVHAYQDQAPGMLPPTGHYCRERCEWYRPTSTDLAVACPGVDLKPTGFETLLAPTKPA